MLPFDCVVVVAIAVVVVEKPASVGKSSVGNSGVGKRGRCLKVGAVRQDVGDQSEGAVE